MKALIKIQTELKANKSQYNSHGKYHYRTVEDIMESLKPLLIDTKTYIILSDELVEMGGQVYVKATASLYGEDDVLVQSASAFAKEGIPKGAMSASQNTGSASTYARKYALNGLLALDDTKDDDSRDNSKDNRPTASKATADDFTNVWNEFSSICSQFEVDANAFLGSQIDLTDKKLAHNTMIKWLKSGQQFQDQLIIFKGE